MVGVARFLASALAATAVVALAGCASNASERVAQSRAPAPQLTTGSWIPQKQSKSNPALRTCSFDALRNFGNTTTAAALSYCDPAVN